jgi:hypothetical protein
MVIFLFHRVSLGLQRKCGIWGVWGCFGAKRANARPLWAGILFFWLPAAMRTVDDCLARERSYRRRRNCVVRAPSLRSLRPCLRSLSSKCPSVRLGLCGGARAFGKQWTAQCLVCSRVLALSTFCLRFKFPPCTHPKAHRNFQTPPILAAPSPFDVLHDPPFSLPRPQTPSQTSADPPSCNHGYQPGVGGDPLPWCVALTSHRMHWEPASLD